MKVDIFNTDKKYDIIYADPPWAYKVWSKKQECGRTAISHYNVMAQSEIEALPINKLANKNSVLFLWVTAPCLEQGLELVKKWGFKYKTIGFTWVKKNKKSDSLFWGMGCYTRANAEFCILATKGKPLPRLVRNIHQVVMTPVEEHSKKPAEVRERIEKLFGGGHNQN